MATLNAPQRVRASNPHALYRMRISRHPGSLRSAGRFLASLMSISNREAHALIEGASGLTVDTCEAHRGLILAILSMEGWTASFEELSRYPDDAEPPACCAGAQGS